MVYGIETDLSGTALKTDFSTVLHGVLTFGVNWLFSPGGKEPHGMWEGNYIGGHVGGDWVNETTASYSVPVAP